MSDRFRHDQMESNSEDYSNHNPRWGRRGFMARLRTRGPFRADNGIFFGVAKGLANHFGWSVGLVRLVIVLATIFLFFWPTVFVYLVAALVLSPTPSGHLKTPQERDIWLQTQMDPDAAMGQLARRAKAVEKRLRRLEDFVTSREYTWSKKMEQ